MVAWGYAQFSDVTAHHVFYFLSYSVVFGVRMLTKCRKCLYTFYCPFAAITIFIITIQCTVKLSFIPFIHLSESQFTISI